jgi:hypothetical protein
LTSVSNHSPGTPPVSSAGQTPPKIAGETDPLAALIAQSERAATWLLEFESSPQRQAALVELAEQAHRAADALLAQRQDAGSLPTHGGTP